MKKLNAKKNTNKPEIPGKVKKGYRIYVMAVLALTLTMSMGMTAFAAGDPITVVNNLSDFIFGLILSLIHIYPSAKSIFIWITMPSDEVL